MAQSVLKSCNNLTKHNGGYCRAEHCKEDKELLRRNRVKSKLQTTKEA
jgi:hypothetical protein